MLKYMHSRNFGGEGGLRVIWRNPDLTGFSLMMASLRVYGSQDYQQQLMFMDNCLLHFHDNKSSSKMSTFFCQNCPQTWFAGSHLFSCLVFFICPASKIALNVDYFIDMIDLTTGSFYIMLTQQPPIDLFKCRN